MGSVPLLFRFSHSGVKGCFTPFSFWHEWHARCLCETWRSLLMGLKAKAVICWHLLSQGPDDLRKVKQA